MALSVHKGAASQLLLRHGSVLLRAFSCSALSQAKNAETVFSFFSHVEEAPKDPILVSYQKVITNKHATRFGGACTQLSPVLCIRGLGELGEGWCSGGEKLGFRFDPSMRPGKAKGYY